MATPFGNNQRTGLTQPQVQDIIDESLEDINGRILDDSTDLAALKGYFDTNQQLKSANLTPNIQQSQISGLSTRLTTDETNITTNTNNITAVTTRTTNLEGYFDTNQQLKSANLTPNIQQSQISGLSTRLTTDETNITTNTNNVTTLQSYFTSGILKLANLTSNIPLSNLATTGTPSVGTFLRGDGAWQAVLPVAANYATQSVNSSLNFWLSQITTSGYLQYYNAGTYTISSAITLPSFNNVVIDAVLPRTRFLNNVSWGLGFSVSLPVGNSGWSFRNIKLNNLIIQGSGGDTVFENAIFGTNITISNYSTGNIYFNQCGFAVGNTINIAASLTSTNIYFRDCDFGSCVISNVLTVGQTTVSVNIGDGCTNIISYSIGNRVFFTGSVTTSTDSRNYSNTKLIYDTLSNLAYKWNPLTDFVIPNDNSLFLKGDGNFTALSLNPATNYVTGGGLLGGATKTFDIQSYIKSGCSSGIINGLLCSFTGLGATIVTVASGTGLIIDNTTNPLNPIAYPVAVATSTTANIITGSNLNFVYLTNTGTIQVLTTFTMQDTYDKLFLCKLFLNAAKTGISHLVPKGQMIQNPSLMFSSFIRNLTYINLGITIVVNGANLFLNVLGGKMYAIGCNNMNSPTDPNSKLIPSASIIQFQLLTQTAYVNDSFTTSVPTAAFYDVGGTLTANGAGNNTAVNHRFMMYCDGTYVLQYGQQVYTNLTNAVAGLSTEAYIQSVSGDGCIILAYISIVKNATQLNNTGQCIISNAASIGNTNVTSVASNASTWIGTATSDLDLTNTYKVINMAPPTNLNDATTKTYVDSSDLLFVAAVSTSNIATIGTATITTIDGYTMIAGNRFLASAQTVTTENGIYTYVVGASVKLVPQTKQVFIQNGTVNTNKIYYNTTGNTWITISSGSGGSGGGYTSITAPTPTAGTFNYTVPANIYNIRVTIAAGGGGGGQANGNTASGGGGGGCGTKIIAVTPGQIIPYVVGAGGIANTGTGGTTIFGGTTTGSCYCYATGGQANSGPPGTFTDGNLITGNFIAYNSSEGHYGMVDTTGSNNMGGAGGGTFLSGTVKYIRNGTPSENGFSYGGGGSGACNVSGTTNGGIGGVGGVIIEEANGNSLVLSSSVMQGAVTVQYTTNVGTNDHIRYNQILFTKGSGIILDTTTTYTNGAGASLGRITLAAGATFRLNGSVSFDCAANGAFQLFAWYNVTTSSYIGLGNGWFCSSTMVSNATGPGVTAYITTTASTIVELRLKISSTAPSLIHGANTFTSEGCKFTIETIDSVSITGMTNPATANLDMSNNKIINLATPTLSTDATNKTYVDSLTVGFKNMVSFTSSTTFNVPAAITNIKYLVIGSGGGGSGAAGGNTGSGGGGGGSAIGYITVTPGQTLTITVANAGTAGASGGNGTGGGAASLVGTGFTSISCNGGGGGLSGGGDGGLGGTASNGNLNIGGINGGFGMQFNPMVPGNVGACGIGGGTVYPSTITRSFTTGSNGRPGSGCGGSGGGNYLGVTYAGGNGGAGLVLLEY